MAHEGPEGLANWIKTTWLPYLERIPENLRERFVDELITRYLQDHPLDASGRCHVAMVRLEVEAIRY
jgi:trans-aconitate methyltransferase